MSIYPWVPALASVNLGCQLVQFVEAIIDTGMQAALDAYGLKQGDDADTSMEVRFNLILI